MSRLLFAVAVGVFMVSSGVVFAQTEEKPFTVNPAFLEALSREVQKMDPWAELVLEQDYTSTVTASRATVVLFSLPRMQELEAAGYIGFEGAYNPNDDQFIIPYSDPWPASAISSVAHEMWHVFYDSEGKQHGLFYSERFTGPSVEEIAAFAHTKAESEPFQRLKAKLVLDARMQAAVGNVRSLMHNALKAQEAFEVLKKTKEFRESRDNLHEHMTPEVLVQLDEEYERLLGRVREASDALEAFVLPLKPLLEIPEEQRTEEVLEEIIQHIKKYQEPISTIAVLAKEVRTFRRQCKDRYYEAEDAMLLENVRLIEENLAVATDSAVRQAFEEQLDFAKMVLSHTQSSRQTFEMLEEFVDVMASFTIGEAMDSIMTGVNIRSIGEVLGDPNEVMARTVWSLYSLYMGPVDQNEFPLSEDDLQFLALFTYDGVSMFRKGIEKYRLALRMIADGVAPETVTADLEYATTYTYQDEQFEWPATHFVIIGTPHIEHADDTATESDEEEVTPVTESSTSDSTNEAK